MSSFESEGHEDFAPQFAHGVAKEIPFGRYRAKGYLAGFSSDSVEVAVYQKQVTVVLGLAFGYEPPSVPSILRGRIMGLSTGDTTKTFVRLTAVFAHQSMDSAVSHDGEFELCGFSPSGNYILTVVSDRGVLSTRLIAMPYTAPLLRFGSAKTRPCNPSAIELDATGPCENFYIGRDEPAQRHGRLE
jgi:hypothetical protein